ncbi:hypothetical protein [Kordia sp.]|uniref:hypothetical protein n=1 Tax=Kordia sp. TaxID=1965332 RepID=UPI003D6C0246
MRNLTLLKVYFWIYLVSCLILILFNWKLVFYKGISEISFMFEFMLIGFLGLLIDWVLVKMVKNEQVFQGLELLVVFVFSIIVWNKF